MGIGALAVAYAWYAYYRVELRISATLWLWVARSLAFATIIALLLDVRIGGRGVAEDERIVLLDESPSMFAAGADGAPWSPAEVRSRELESAGWRVVRFGGEGEPTQPSRVGTMIAPALRRAVELGAREVAVLSDMRFVDPVVAEGELIIIPARVVFEPFSKRLVNVGISAFSVADAPVPSSPVAAEVEIHGLGSDSAMIEVVPEGGDTVSRTVLLPAPGRSRRVTLMVEAPAEAGRKLYTARVTPVEAAGRVNGPVAESVESRVVDAPLATDAFPADDRVVAEAAVGHRLGAIVLVSMAADWEPRYLLDALAQATGLPAVGYLRVGPDRFAPMGSVAERSPPVDPATVSRAIAAAALLVAHSFPNAEGAIADALSVGSAPIIFFTATPAASALTGLETGAPLDDDWYPVPEPPPSPVAPELVSAFPPGLPPLTGLLVVPDPAASGATSVLEVRRPASTENVAAIHLLQRDGRRVAVAAASGFWRWAMREGGSRDAYRRLWSAVAGWLIDNASDNEPVLGPKEPERPSTELMPAPVVLGGGEPRPPGAKVGADVPLRTVAWPYLLVIFLLCAEWYGRRRGGLR